jgi:hypothetical protein
VFTLLSAGAVVIFALAVIVFIYPLTRPTHFEFRRSVPSVGNIMHLVFNIDKMIGRDFEAGLADLRALAEK